ncbi:hypothetical protein LOTGIDRAFT_233561 [Lottia gigantea]|uniref:Glycerophosphocholine acyltransferase 1 n=1 Tax=Lottia gigantea TaxID=225164 RepID=V4BQD1_LOTGI|nr:hypothetical protein LOTGIDRAFT_233561 [Lottia gigantea]ESO91084.1 hypothetical protein LOTGIDRAFT_233561 [Lottia gigantea]
MMVDKEDAKRKTQNYNTGTSRESGVEKHIKKMSDRMKQVKAHLSLEEQDLREFLLVLKKKRLQEKLVYVISIGTIILLTHSLMASQWLLPYYYTISTPCLLLIRTIIYWKYKWNYFLLDFCYYGNVLWYLFLWIWPQHGNIFMASFAVANGPLLWAAVIFRNSLVLHSVDKVTSVYIHTLPAFLSFALRWYSEDTSMKWRKDFVPDINNWSVQWLIVVPFLGFVLHSILHSILTSIFPPPEEYLTSYKCLTAQESSFMFKAVDLLGPNYRVVLYVVFNWIYCLVSVTLSIIWYNCFLAHAVFIAFIFFIITYNGATYYLDVFSVRKKSDE